MALDITKELGQNFIDYAYAVNCDRSIPDAKSGLKPVARRILWGALHSGRTSNKAYVKNARIVGDVMGAWHPHGDSSIYGALVRLSQPWVLRYPLIDFHGNQGNICGDGPAAMRYTEGRLNKLAEEGMLAGIKKNCVDFMPNYSDDNQEPITLPSIFPNLLCNPNGGIGVAMACNWACHNLREVRDAIFSYMDGKEPMLPGPDFPTGGIIINKNDIPAIMQTGHGSVKLRAKYEVKKNAIIITEIPYGTTVENLLTEIGKYTEENNNTGITDIRDKTDHKGVAITIKFDKASNPDVIMNKLFSKTNLQTSFSYNQVALIDKTPTEMNLKDCCRVYVNHNIECIKRETQFDLDKTKARLHIVEGLFIALEDIDNVIKLIKESESSAAAKDNLINKYKLSEVQAQAILDMKLSRLAKLEKIALENEKTKLNETIGELTEILSSEDKQKSILRNKLNTIVDKFGDERRTKLAQIEVPKEEKEIAEVVPVDVIVVTSESGLIKKIPVSNYRVQRKGGKGIKSTDNVVMSTIKTNTVDYMMFFTNRGKVYRTVVDNIPDGTNASRGVPINSLVKLESDEHIVGVTSLHRQKLPKFAIFITKFGLIKKTALSEYLGTRRNNGIAAIKLKEGDSVAKVSFQDDEDMIIITKKGMSIKFATNTIGMTGRSTMGIKAINLIKDDEVVAALPIHKTTDKVALITTKGIGKKIDIKDFPQQGRGGKGTVCSKDELAGALMVDDDDNILISGNKNIICISAKDVPLLSKAAVGNILIKSNIVLAITKI